MEIDYIIVQAGGMGTRLGHLTKNKPKAMVPIENLPMIFHLFKKFPNKKYIIIADYKKEILKKYLSAFAFVDYCVVDAVGKGTCAGINLALSKISNGKSFLMIWCDLILSENFSLSLENNNYVGISNDFKCRWSYVNNEFIEEPSFENGVAGLFVFKNKKILSDVPEEGEFVRWLSTKNIEFNRIILKGTKEFGTTEEYEKLEVNKCRPFNKIIVENNKFIKIPLDSQGEELATKEINWYSKVQKLGFKNIPKIYSTSPLSLEFIEGKNIYQLNDYSNKEKNKILTLIINSLKELHSLSTSKVDDESVKQTYVTKTFDRLKKVQDLVPFAKEKYIIINGKKCHNVFFFKDELVNKLSKIKVDKFSLIHGDCTFSNIMINESKCILIDPRGYFGKTLLYGDPNYDWAKLYYSLKGNYDKFNLKQFTLDIDEKEVTLNIESNGWEKLEEDFFKLLGKEVNVEEIKLLHAIIWLSLTTYAWQDYDSICGAFYNGLYYLEEVI